MDDAVPRGRWIRLGIAGILAVLTGLLVLARPAAASAYLVAATPSHESVVPAAPQEVVLVFSERVDVVGDGVAVVGPSGGRVDPGTVRRPRPEVVVVPLPGVVAVTRPGTYTVSWHVVSADSRPASGAFTFSIGSAPGPAPPSTAAGAAGRGAGPVVAAAYRLAGWAALAGLAMLVGGVTLGRYGVPAPDVRARLRGFAAEGWMTLVFATLALLALRGPYAAGTGLARALDRDLLGQTLHTHFGRALAVRLVLLGAAPVLLELGAGGADAKPRRRAAGAVGGVVALALTWTAIGDAATAGTPTALLAGVVGLLAAATWLGGLAAISVAFRQLPPAGWLTTSAEATMEPGILARRFARLTALCATLIIIVGCYEAGRSLGGAAGLATTAYGRLLTVQMVLLAGVTALAILLCARLRVLGGAGRPGRVPRRMAAAGTILAALVLAGITAQADVTPGVQARAARPTTRFARFDAGGGAGGTRSMSVRLPRTLRGVDEAILTVRDAGGAPHDIPRAQATWTQIIIGVGPLPVRFTHLGTGRYRLDWPPLPVAGPWRLKLSVPRTGRTGATATLTVRIR
jgi:copper transport protein